MQVYYDGSHSLLIGDFINGSFDESGFLHTWNDLHLIPSEAPAIAPPPLKIETVDIPGANGSVDLTEILTGIPLYENRTGSIEFYIDNSNDEYADKSGYRWDYAYDKLLNTLHGFRRKLILTDSRSSYYEGRLSVNSYKSDKVTGIITLDYDLDPFKRSLFTTAEPWLWNPFDFVDGIIPDQSMFKKIVGNGASLEYEISQYFTGTVPTVPTIKIETTVRVNWELTKASGGVPSFGFRPMGASDYLWVDFKETDMVYNKPAEEGGALFVMNAPIANNGASCVIGDPRPGYTFKFQYVNTLRDDDNQPIPAIFYLDYRPGRL